MRAGPATAACEWAIHTPVQSASVPPATISRIRNQSHQSFLLPEFSHGDVFHDTNNDGQMSRFPVHIASRSFRAAHNFKTEGNKNRLFACR